MFKSLLGYPSATLLVEVKAYPYIIGWKHRHVGTEMFVDVIAGVRVASYSQSIHYCRRRRVWIPHCLTWLHGPRVSLSLICLFGSQDVEMISFELQRSWSACAEGERDTHHE